MTSITNPFVDGLQGALKAEPHQEPTPLQVAHHETAAVFQHARDLLDERGFDVWLDIVTNEVAHLNGLRLFREQRRGA